VNTTGGRDFPPLFYAVIRIVDRFSDLTGRLISLSMLFLVACITYEVFVRYVFNAPTIWVFEASSMVNGAAFMLGCGYALLKGAHVRTDIFWDNFSERRRGAIDLTSYVLFFLPATLTIMLISIDDAFLAWQMDERSQQSPWRAVTWPFKAAVPLAMLLFMIQGVSEALKCVYQIRYGREFQQREKLEV
jgi:TRAP-type mannitol/chloroaromatic compound transport system permease small subunit